MKKSLLSIIALLTLSGCVPENFHQAQTLATQTTHSVYRAETIPVYQEIHHEPIHDAFYEQRQYEIAEQRARHAAQKRAYQRKIRAQKRHLKAIQRQNQHLAAQQRAQQIADKNTRYHALRQQQAQRIAQQQRAQQRAIEKQRLYEKAALKRRQDERRRLAEINARQNRAKAQKHAKSTGQNHLSSSVFKNELAQAIAARRARQGN